MGREKLANLIFPEVSLTIADLEKKYPNRNLAVGSEVTRFAPSPTGFLHTGSLFAALIAKTVAVQTKGVFYLRLEDTDTKREIEGAGIRQLSEMAQFDVSPMEGYLGTEEKGEYGPYCQSDRAMIYKTVIKQMLIDNIAYPCFASSEELNALRATQEASKVVPGYYGPYATSSFLSEEQAIEKIEKGLPYVIRFRSKGNHENKIVFTDLIKGQIEIAENDQHIVILKSDGLPTYHFAHVVDDHFMRTTLVTRGEEWISSVPLHIELFNALNFATPRYAHLPVINKLDNGNKRKLSKRKDPEAAVTFFLNLGYPVKAILTYLMSIANSNFEEWWTNNKEEKLDRFPFSLEKMNVDGALFDIEKVNFFAREYLATLTAQEMTSQYLAFAQYTNDNTLINLIKNNKDTFNKIFNIEREGEKPRKDYAFFAMVYPSVKFFFPELYAKMAENGEIESFNEKIAKSLINNILEDMKTELVYECGNEGWFESLKTIASKHGFALNNKEFKANPENYNGTVADVAEILRIAIVGSRKSPNLFEVLSILGIKEINRRLEEAKMV